MEVWTVIALAISSHWVHLKKEIFSQIMRAAVSLSFGMGWGNEFLSFFAPTVVSWMGT